MNNPYGKIIWVKITQEITSYNKKRGVSTMSGQPPDIRLQGLLKYSESYDPEYMFAIALRVFSIISPQLSFRCLCKYLSCWVFRLTSVRQWCTIDWLKLFCWRCCSRLSLFLTFRQQFPPLRQLCLLPIASEGSLSFALCGI